ncbi:MAG: glutamate 5-kinase [Pseudomonadota bacterium]|uniref:Glutamate 5-kinase n=1 Tax=Thermobispora bispora (strain ATCC 19993 / DSM 43833 / CBS 139.67 / JCM 10125 / KCTC 9307 / NBRC 14880 / R51) TaxID=469371 RepID=D6Y4I4_THEBD|nr:glutamate 5-kinase [Thermobispora bispora]ADG89160.1 glutamate 5-kinase [Thermobispora bispora DSM 43833]MBX6169166.1 glutamate 5-kinase [Thermobispora bispora]MDI9525661.1 glutamate 5-kinase [Pseudomonadota bacterium]
MADRSRIGTAQRLVVKVGSSSLTTDQGTIDVDRIDALVDVLARRRLDGTQIVLVSSGAIAAGLGPLGLKDRPKDLALQQAAASVGQGLLVARYTSSFARYGLRVGQVLLTAFDMMRRSHHRNAQRTLTKLLELGIVPIVNENDTVATDEIRFGDNDRLAALVAHLVHADGMVLLSDVDALYDGDPRRPGARRITEVRGPEDLKGVELGTSGRVGTGGMITKVQAARIATGAGVPVVLTAAAYAAQALAGAEVGTFFHPSGRRPGTRLLWLAHATTGRGRLYLDDGAVAAVVLRRKSLLPAGVVKVEGDFAAGDPVDLCDLSGTRVARGLVNYDAAEIPELLGRSTRELARALGPEYQRELIHRDDIVILDPHDE